MAQPLPQTDMNELDNAAYDSAVNGIDASAARLEKAFRRLESAVSHAGSRYASLKGDKEKLNHLLQSAERDVAQMREAVKLVTGRLDHTIATLEALEQ